MLMFVATKLGSGTGAWGLLVALVTCACGGTQKGTHTCTCVCADTSLHWSGVITRIPTLC